MNIENNIDPGIVLQNWRTKILNVFLVVVVIAASVMTAVSIVDAISRPGQWPPVIIFAILDVALIAIAIFPVDYRIRAWGTLLVPYVVGVTTLASYGLGSSGRLYLLVVPIGALILISVRSGIFMSALSILTMGVFAVLAERGVLLVWLIGDRNSLLLADWLAEFADTFMLLATVMTLLIMFYRFQERLIDKERHTQSDLRRAQSLLEEQNTTLEQKVQERTRELLQSNKIQTVIYNIADAAGASRDMQEFFRHVHRIIGELLYAKNIFIALYDETTGLLSFPYFVDEKDKPFPTQPLEDFHGMTHYMIRTGIPIKHGWAQFNELLDKHEVEVQGTYNEDGIGAPLKAGGKILGAIYLQSYTPGIGYTEQDDEILGFVAQHIATALTRLQALEAERQRNNELAILNSIGEAMVKTLDIKTMARLVGDKVREIFEADSTLIMLLERQTNLINVPYEYDRNEGGYIDYVEPFPLGTGLSSKVIFTGQPLNLGTLDEEMANGAYFPPEIIEKGSGFFSQSWLGVPIIAKGQTLGLVALADARMHAFNDNHLRLLQTLSANLGMAIENARLFQSEQQRASELAIINSVQNSVQAGLASHLDLQAIYELVGEKVCEIFNANTVVLLTFDLDKNLMYRHFTIERGVRYTFEPLPIPTYWHDFIAQNRSQLINHNLLGAMQKVDPDFQVAAGDIPKSALTVPLRIQGKLHGAISLQNVDRENAFTESDLHLLENLANSLSAALENAGLFNETQRLLKETEQRNNELAILNSISEAISRTLDVKALLRIMGDKIRDIFQADGVVITLLDKQTNLLQRLYEFDKGEGGYVDVDYIKPYPMGMGLTSKVILTRQPLLMGDFNEQLASGAYFPPGSLEQTSGKVTQSWLGVPMIVNDQAVGVIQLGDYQPNAYNENHLRLLQTLSSNMGVAIENAHLFQAEQQRVAELATINNIQEILASNLDIDTVYELIGQKIGQIFNVQVVDIVTYDPATHLMSMPYSYEKGDRSVITPREPYGFRLQVLESGQPLVINQDFVKLAEACNNPLVAGEWPKSAIFAPLLVDGKARGVISIQDLDHENAFSPSAVRLLQTLASSMGVTFENVRLFTETQRLFQAEQRAHQQAEILRSVAQALNRSLSLAEVFNLVLTEIQKVIPYDSAGVYQVHDNRREFVTGRGFTNLDELMGVSFEFNREDDEIGYLISQSLQPLILEDAANRYPQYFNSGSHAAAKIRSYMAVPIVHDQKLIGMITLDKKETGFYEEQHAQLAMAFAAQAATAINNARLFDAEQQRVAELAIINTVSRELASELGLEPLIHLVGEQMRMVFKADIAYVALLDERYNMIEFPYTYGENLPTLHYGEGLTGKIIQTGEPLLINQQMDRQTHELGSAVIGKQALSYLGVPIFVSGKPVGVISVQSTKREGVFNLNDQNLLNTLASNVGTALHNARLFDQAREARAAAEQANRSKSAFLANMSHELRTPLNAIIGFTRIVRRKTESLIPEKQSENLDKVLTSAEHLLNLINTVLDIAKIESGRMDVLAANFRIAPLIDLCANTAQPLLRPGVVLEKQVDESLASMYSDQDKIRQIVLNLLSNAAKFTHAGKIILAAGSDGEHLRISVADTGIGISAEALPRIFKEFQQADNTTTRQYGGTGLGLSISRNLAHLLGGDIKVESEPGQGSTFTLVIPVQFVNRSTLPTEQELAASQPVDATPAPVSAKKRLLVIDDDPDAVYLLQENLNQQEYEVIGTRNGLDGLRLAREQQPQAILLDVIMPGVDGWQVLHDLKKNAETANIPVILLTIVDKKALGFRLGAAAYLLKPLDPVAVREALQRVIRAGDQSQKRLLVVDDDPNVADMLRQFLPEEEFKLDAALDGMAGLEAIAALRPDILLLDIMMPRLDGFGVIEALRADPQTRSLPIIVISAKDLTETEGARLKESVAAVLKKQSFQGEKLMDEIKSILQPGQRRKNI